MRYGSMVSALAILGFAGSGAFAQDFSDEELGLRIRLDRPGFVPGEPVVFRVKNESGSAFTLKLSGLKVWRGDRIVYSAREDLSDLRLQNGRTYTGSWDRKDNYGRTVPPGVYELSVYADGHGWDDIPILQVRISFTLHRSMRGSVKLHTLRSRYTEDDVVTFYVINRGVRPITLPNSDPWQIARIRGRSRTVIHDPGRPENPIVLRPGEHRLWTWDPGRRLDEGKYRITLSYRITHNVRKTVKTDFQYLVME